MWLAAFRARLGVEHTRNKEKSLVRKRDPRVEAPPEVCIGESLNCAVFTRPAVEERVTEGGASVEREWEHGWRVGEASEVDGSDGVHGCDGNFRACIRGCTREDGERASKIVLLECTEGLVLYLRDMILVCETNDGGEFIECSDWIVFSWAIARKIDVAWANT